MKKVLQEEEETLLFIRQNKVWIHSWLWWNKKSSCIKYYNFNNQYGWALSQSPPCGGFEFVEDLSMITSEFVISYDIKGSASCTLIVDVVYPISLQPLHRDLAFLSDY